MIRVVTKADTGSLQWVEGLDAAQAVLRGKAETRPRVWLDFIAPTPEEIDILRKELNFAEFSIEDATREEHPPKVEEVGQDGDRAAYLFVVARAPLSGGSATSEGVALFLRSRLLVTVHMQDSARVNTALERILRDPKQTIALGIEFAAHAILDELVEAYEPTLDEFESKIESLEEEIVKDHEHCGLDKIFVLRQMAMQLHREARPMRDVMSSLAREGHPLIKVKARVAFRDLYDHIQRTLDRLETDRELVASLRDAFLALQNNRMNEVMKTLTVVAVISGALAVVTGVFGMNLKIPLADSEHGFVISLLGMAAISGMIFLLFRLKRWI